MFLLPGTEIRQGKKKDKHRLCLIAQNALILFDRRLDSIRIEYKREGIDMLRFDWPEVPLRKEGNNTQAQWTKIQSDLCFLECYRKLHQKGFYITATQQSDQDFWVDYRGVYRKAKWKLRRLREKIIFQHLFLVTAVGLDASQNKHFSVRFEGMFTFAMDVLYQELVESDRTKDWGRKSLKKLATYRSAVEKNPMHRLIPGVESLHVNEVTRLVSELFLLNLRRWDRTHGLDIPGAHRVLEVFAFELERCNTVAFRPEAKWTGCDTGKTWRGIE